GARRFGPGQPGVGSTGGHPRRRHPAALAAAPRGDRRGGSRRLGPGLTRRPRLHRRPGLRQCSSWGPGPADGRSVKPPLLTNTYHLCGVGLPPLLAPPPRLAFLGLRGLAAAYTYRQPAEGVATFGPPPSGPPLAGLGAALA